MGLFKKTTAAEKRQKTNKRDAKKELRHEKRDVKKDARQDKKEVKKDARAIKKDIRQEARADKKEIRQSDLKGKDKRDAKKDVRQDKRADVKDIKENKKTIVKDIKNDKKAEVKDIKEEIKDVKHWLHVELPSTAANKALLREDLRDIKYVVNASMNTPEKEITIDDIYQILRDAHDKARELSEKALRMLTNIVDEPKDEWLSLWADKPKLVKWFGAATKPNHVKEVYNRMASVDRRLNKKITVRMHPQRDESTNAQNMGWFAEPKTFKIFPQLIRTSLNDDKEIGYDIIASVMIHELVHLKVKDQKHDGETVYGEDKALSVADENARKARRSPENYEHYCLTFA